MPPASIVQIAVNTMGGLSIVGQVPVGGAQQAVTVDENFVYSVNTNPMALVGYAMV